MFLNQYITLCYACNEIQLHLKSFNSAKYFTPSKHSTDMKTQYLCETVNYYYPCFIHRGSRSAERLKVSTETTQLVRVRVCINGGHIISSLTAQGTGSAPFPPTQPDCAATAIQSSQWHPVPTLCFFFLWTGRDWKKQEALIFSWDKSEGGKLCCIWQALLLPIH